MADRTTPDQPRTVVGLANPASVYCYEQGGTLVISKDPATGGEVGHCHLPDGRVVEEWALFRAAQQQQQESTTVDSGSDHVDTQFSGTALAIESPQAIRRC